MADESEKRSPLTSQQAHLVELMSAFESAPGWPADMNNVIIYMTLHANLLRIPDEQWEGARENTLTGFNEADQPLVRRKLNACRAVYQDNRTFWDTFFIAEERFKVGQINYVMRRPQE